MEFRFSSHCYSRLPADGEAIPPDLSVRDGSDHHPRNRIYDQVRYLSLKLVDCIDNIIATDAVVTRSKHNNFFHVSVAEATPAGVATQVDYYVFMSARKVSEPNQPKMIKIFVETAYPNDPGGAGSGRWREPLVRDHAGRILGPPEKVKASAREAFGIVARISFVPLGVEPLSWRRTAGLDASLSCYFSRCFRNAARCIHNP